MSPDRSRHWSRSLTPLALGVVSGILLAAALSVLSSAAEELTIIHTNDIHGAFLSREASWTDDERQVGGFEALADRVREIRASGKPVLLLDAGDFMTGNPICDVEVGGAKGGALVELMNALDYDAMALGNHEFDISQENARALIEMADFPVLSCNLVRSDGRPFTPQVAVVKEVGSVRVGIIGVMTEGLAGVVQRDRIEGLRVLGATERVQALADSLDPMTDLIVVLSHMGVESDRELARTVEGVDVIVGGHSHTRLTRPERINEVLVVQAGSRLTEFGQLNLRVRDDRVDRWDGRLVNLWIEGMTPQEDIREMTERFEALVEGSFGEVLGTLRVDWTREYDAESNIGNWITDAMREVTAADFAALNSGGIRKNLAAGPVRKLDVYEILPFSNELCRFECTGAELLTMIQTNAEAQARRSHGILQVSGIRYAFRISGDRVEVAEAEVGGEPIDPEATYTGISVDFVAVSQSDKYLGFTPTEIYRTGQLVNEIVVDAVRRAGPIDDGVDGRIRELP